MNDDPRTHIEQGGVDEPESTIEKTASDVSRVEQLGGHGSGKTDGKWSFGMLNDKLTDEVPGEISRSLLDIDWIKVANLFV